MKRRDLYIAVAVIAIALVSVIAVSQDELSWGGVLARIFNSSNESLQVSIVSQADDLDISEETALTNTVNNILTMTHTTSGTPANNIGLGIDYLQETSAANNETVMKLDAVMTDVTAASEDAKLSVKLMAAGAAAAEKLSVGSTGIVTLAGSGTIDNSTSASRLDLTEDVIDQSGWRAMSIVTTSAQSYSLASAGKAGMVIQTAGEAATLHLMTDLLTTPGAGGWFVIKTGDASDIVIDTEGAETIEGADTYTIDGTLEAVTIATDGTNYHVIGSYLE